MDSLLLKHRLINGKRALLAVVCDGVGSLAKGAFASGAAARMLNEWFDTILMAERIGLKMRDVILEINIHIISESRQKNINTASTLSALLLLDESYCVAHIGDSRIYSYEKGMLTLLTHDDVSETGRLTACIGQTDNIVLQYSEGNAIGKVFLVCSDGLYKRMNTDFLTAKLKIQNKHDLNNSLKALVQYAIEQGEKDNISIAMVKIEN